MQYANLDQPAQPQQPQRNTQPVTQPTMTNQPRSNRKAAKKQKKIKRIIWGAVAVILIFIVIKFASPLLKLGQIVGSTPGLAYSVVANQDPNLKNQNGRTNILLFGTGGGNHDGPNLTDSIIVASVDIKTGQTSIFSFPRDVYLPDTQQKINAIYQDGIDKGNGIGFAEQEIGKYIGMPIDYTFRIDFDGFVKAIDTVGGIDVQVANTFDDYQYPIDGKEHDLCGFIETTEPIGASSPNPSASPSSASASASTQPKTRDVFINQSTGQKIYADEVSDTNNPYACRYEHLHFTKGLTHMDGTTALKFVRSRHALGPEGSDFARSRRQQAVIVAFRQAVISKETLFDVGKIQSLISTFGSSIDTDIQPSEYGQFYLLYKRVKSQPIHTFALSDGSDAGLPVFYNPPEADYGGAWVLVPKNDDWTTVRDAIQQALVATPTPSPTTTSVPLPSGSVKINKTRQ